MSASGIGASGKPKLAMYWAAGCGGCEISVINTHEFILDIDANFDVVFWPVAIDTKYKDVRAMPDASIDVTLFNGGIRSDEHEEMAHLLRQKSKVLVAFGACASLGSIPGLANLSTHQSMFDAAYQSNSTDNPNHLRPQSRFTMPEGELHLPTLNPVLKTLDQVTRVDYYLPGCPPESNKVAAVVGLVIKALHGEAQLPPAGSIVGAGESSVCQECPRQRNVKAIKAFTRIQDLARIDPDLCLLEQGVPCNGPATRDGCDARCPRAGAQCIGCYGPANGVIDYGARLLSAFASVIDAEKPEDIDRVLDTLPDISGQLYRFSLAKSLLRANKAAWAGK